MVAASVCLAIPVNCVKLIKIIRKERLQIIFCFFNGLAECQIIRFFTVCRRTSTGLLLSSTCVYLLHQFFYLIIQVPADCKLTHPVRYPGIIQLLFGTVYEISNRLITCVGRMIFIPFISIGNADRIKKLLIIVIFDRSCAVTVLDPIVCHFQQSCVTRVCLITDQTVMVIIQSRIGNRCIIRIFKQRICLMRNLCIDLIDQHWKRFICGKLLSISPFSSPTVLPYNFSIFIPVQSFQI